jgi:hypothetical protein
MRIRRPSFLALAMLTLLTQISCSSEGGLRASDDHLIVPGTRVGPFKLGMTDQELFQIGIPDGTRPWGDYVVYWFGDRNVQVNSQSRRVERIFTSNKSDRTSSGVGVRSSLPDFFRAFGPPDRTVVGNDVCGVPGRVEHVYYQSGNMWLDFSPVGASCADAPTSRVQSLGIKTPGAESF